MCVLWVTCSQNDIAKTICSYLCCSEFPSRWIYQVCDKHKTKERNIVKSWWEGTSTHTLSFAHNVYVNMFVHTCTYVYAHVCIYGSHKRRRWCESTFVFVGIKIHTNIHMHMYIHSYEHLDMYSSRCAFHWTHAKSTTCWYSGFNFTSNGSDLNCQWTCTNMFAYTFVPNVVFTIIHMHMCVDLGIFEEDNYTITCIHKWRIFIGMCVCQTADKLGNAF